MAPRAHDRLPEIFVLARHRKARLALEGVRKELGRARSAKRQETLKLAEKVLAWYDAAMSGRFEEGLSDALQAIPQLQERGYGPSVSWALTAAGFCMGLVGDIEMGLKWNQACMEEAERQKDVAIVLRARCDRAALMGMLGNFEQAVIHFRQAVADMGGSSPNPERGTALNNMAFCCLSMARMAGDNPESQAQLATEALECAVRAAEDAEGAAEPLRLKVWSLSSQGAALTLLGRHAEAEAAFAQALPHMDVNRRNGTVLLANYARLLVATGRLDQASRWLQEAAERAPADILDSTLDIVMEVQLELALARGRPEEALRCTQLRIERLRAQQLARVRSATRHLEVFWQAERERAAERELAQQQITVARKRLEQTQRSLLQAQLQSERERFRERERVLQDMHDGFGSQLASARMLAERGNLTAPQLVEVLDDCMADLYLVADTLSEPEASLAGALADFRFRCERRLGGLPLQVHWDIDLEDADSTSDRTNLQILRIVQEALNNALRHSQARNVGVRARGGGEGLLMIEIVDDGQGMPTDGRSGRGVGNMQSRARQIGATLQWQPREPGTAVVLSVPTGPTKKK